MSRTAILPVALALLLTVTVFVSTGSSSTSIGFKGGLTFGRAHSEGMINQFGLSKSFRSGLGGGISLGIQVGRQVIWQPELLIVQNGAIYSDPSGSGKVTFKLTMLELPVLFKWRSEKREKLRPELFGGMFLALPLSARYQSRGFFIPPDGDVDIKSELKGELLGVVAGIGMSIRLTNTEITLDARCDYGISGMLKRNMFGVSSDASTYTFLVLTGLRFDI